MILNNELYQTGKTLSCKYADILLDRNLEPLEIRCESPAPYRNLTQKCSQNKLVMRKSLELISTQLLNQVSEG